MAKAPRYDGLEADRSFEAGARIVAHALLAEIVAATPGVLGGEDTRAVHDMRVSIRRLRSALRTFGAAFGRKRRKRMQAAMRRIGRRLGPVRDADVHLAVLRASLAGASAADRAGIAYAIEALGERRRAALASFAIELSQFERDAFVAALDG